MELRLQRVTSVTTKVRRLGYFAYFSKLLSQESVAEMTLMQSTLSEVDCNKALLREAIEKLPTSRGRDIVTGEILNEDAFRRYLHTSKEFGLVHELSRRIYNTKRGEILGSLVKENYFDLSIPQIYLMWRIILENDYDYVKNVILCTIESPKDEDKVFFENIKKIWQQKLKESASINVSVYEELKRAVDTKWTSPERYYKENIKAPIIEWLLDLKAIDYWQVEKNRVTFRGNIMGLVDSNKDNFSESFVTYMEPMITKSKTYWKEILQNKKDEILDDLLSKSFKLFKTRNETPKISASQFFEFAAATLAESGVICEIQNLNEELESYTKKTGKCRYVKISSEADMGYITEL